MNADQTIGVVIGALVTALLLWVFFRRRLAQEQANHALTLEVEMREQQLKLKEARAESELDLQKRQTELERELGRREDALVVRTRELEARLESQARAEREFEEKSRALQQAREALTEAEHEAERTRRLYQLKLHQVTHMDEEDARRLLLRNTEQACERELLELRRERLERAEAEITDEARRVLLAAMQRITSQPMHDATATVVNLPSEEMKGRIIGREGRNIRTFEHATGTTLMIDETPDSVLISCFDPVRREVARLALEALLRDGRIHPASIEEEVVRAQTEMRASVIELGENALRRLRLHDVHPEVVVLLGKLHYRLSNNQNTLEHSVEVANLCALMASELGIDATVAKRAGLFHDIGKAVDEDYEGSHAQVGATIIKHHGEDPRVVNAVAAHHKEVPAESAYAGLVMVADSLSAVRPGARTSSIDGFIQRVRSIEEIASKQPGVSEAYAIQAGRELRVIVQPEMVDDEGARKLARRIRSQIEAELSYPGSVEITVIRETRYTETAV